MRIWRLAEEIICSRTVTTSTQIWVTGIITSYIRTSCRLPHLEAMLLLLCKREWSGQPTLHSTDLVLSSILTLTLKNTIKAEVMNKSDQRFSQDLSIMPIKFDSTEKALDTWNELGYPYKMQFKLHEQKLCPDDKERVEMFSLCCAMRG